jgi:hypothetical protein
MKPIVAEINLGVPSAMTHIGTEAGNAARWTKSDNASDDRFHCRDGALRMPGQRA